MDVAVYEAPITPSYIVVCLFIHRIRLTLRRCIFMPENRQEGGHNEENHSI